MTMRIVFMASGDIALSALKALAGWNDVELCGVVTQPDRPAGRGLHMHAPETKRFAQSVSVPVLQPATFRGENGAAAREWLEERQADFFVVMAFGQILPRSVLELPAIACLNLHASLLPRHRGASPIQAAIAAGDAKTGITVMHMSPELDAGDMVLKCETDIREDETGGSLHDRLAALAPHALRDALDRFQKGDAPRAAQDHTQATYAPKLERKDGEIDWAQPAEIIARRIRAYDPWPGSHTFFQERGCRVLLKVFKACPVLPEERGGWPDVTEVIPGTVAWGGHGVVVRCGEGFLRMHEVQPEGRKRMDAADFVRGARLQDLAQLG